MAGAPEEIQSMQCSSFPFALRRRAPTPCSNTARCYPLIKGLFVFDRRRPGRNPEGRTRRQREALGQGGRSQEEVGGARPVRIIRCWGWGARSPFELPHRGRAGGARLMLMTFFSLVSGESGSGRGRGRGRERGSEGAETATETGTGRGRGGARRGGKRTVLLAGAPAAVLGGIACPLSPSGRGGGRMLPFPSSLFHFSSPFLLNFFS